MRFHIRVLNERGEPLAGAAVWSRGTDRNDEIDWTAAMERLVGRYAVDHDYARPLGLMSSKMIVDYTDGSGEWNGFHAKQSMVLAILKRGYVPTVVETGQQADSAGKGVTIVLKASAAETSDARMERFDQLRAEIFELHRSDIPLARRFEMMTAKRDELHRLAENLERSRPDFAGRVYMNIADLPSIDVSQTQNGEARIKSFTTGYDEDDPVRRSAFQRGLELDRETPWLALFRLSRDSSDSSVKGIDEFKRRELNLKWLGEFDVILKSSPQRIWPQAYITRIYRYMDLRSPQQACQALRQAYSFEPAAKDRKEWSELLNFVQRGAASEGQLFECKPF